METKNGRVELKQTRISTMPHTSVDSIYHLELGPLRKMHVLVTGARTATQGSYDRAGQALDDSQESPLPSCFIPARGRGMQGGGGQRGPRGVRATSRMEAQSWSGRTFMLNITSRHILAVRSSWQHIDNKNNGLTDAAHRSGYCRSDRAVQNAAMASQDRFAGVEANLAVGSPTETKTCV